MRIGRREIPQRGTNLHRTFGKDNRPQAASTHDTGPFGPPARGFASVESICNSADAVQEAPLRSPRLDALLDTLRRARSATYWSEHLPADDPADFDAFKSFPTTLPDVLKSRPHTDFLAVPQSDVFHYHQSFGTTGRPSCGWYTLADIEAEVPIISRWTDTFGPGSVILNRYPYSFPVPNALVETAARVVGGCVIPAGALNFNVAFPRAVNLMRDRGVTVVSSLPWEPIFLAETARLMGLDPKTDFPNLKHWLVAGSLVPPGMRELLEDLWGVDVRVLYGSTEVGPMASTCEHGLMHLHDDAFLFEVVDEVLVVTTLTRQAQPMVRYVTGDACRLTEESCDCGHTGRVIELQGRKAGALQVGDRGIRELELHDAVLQHMKPYKSPVFYSVRTRRGLLLRMETREARTGGKAAAKALTQTLGLPVRVTLHKPGTLINHVALLSGWHVFKPSIVADWTNPKARKVLNWSGALVDWWGTLDVGLMWNAVKKSVSDRLLGWRLRLFG
jgi:phenylacetate-CoA ligase